MVSRKDERRNDGAPVTQRRGPRHWFRCEQGDEGRFKSGDGGGERLYIYAAVHNGHEPAHPGSNDL